MSSALRRMLDLSTECMPEDVRSAGFTAKRWWGSLRVVDHDFGFVVFVDPLEKDIPDWFRPIQAEAVKQDCLVVNFDRDSNNRLETVAETTPGAGPTGVAPVFEPLYKQLSLALSGLSRSRGEWHSRWNDRLRALVKHLPHGSGFDSEPTVSVPGPICDLEVVLAHLNPDFTEYEYQIRAPFHKMNQNGFYCGWVTLVFTVRATFADFDLALTVEGEEDEVKCTDEDCPVHGDGDLDGDSDSDDGCSADTGDRFDEIRQEYALSVYREALLRSVSSSLV